MYFRRKIDQTLADWKADPEHKPLLLRGARQTGKTTAIRNFASGFRYFLEVNLERDEKARLFFRRGDTVRMICSNLEMSYGIPIVPRQTLLFIDEIQACPEAISLLRYFYEEMQDLHVIASGSLLEFAFRSLQDFGVGRIRNAFIYPFSFQEFVNATGHSLLWDGLRQFSFSNPIPAPCHQQLLELLRLFMIIGGMPAVVKKYVERGSLLACKEEQNDILISLKADFDKYSRTVPSGLIRKSLDSVLSQQGGKFKYSDEARGLDSRQGRGAVELLELARLVHKIRMSYGNGLPLGGETNDRMVKYIMLDTGLYLHESGLQLNEWLADSADDFVNRGWLAEVFVGLELLKSFSPLDEAELFYWHREAKSSNAEIDYLIQNRNSVIPVEVKSGSRGSMQSMQLFLSEKNYPWGIRTSQENLCVYDRIKVIPLYLIGEYRRLLD